MDVKQLISWLVPIVARGLAWFFAVRLGMEAAESSDMAAQAAGGLAAVALVAVSVWTSVQGRKKLRDATPPRR